MSRRGGRKLSVWALSLQGPVATGHQMARPGHCMDLQGLWAHTPGAHSDSAGLADDAPSPWRRSPGSPQLRGHAEQAAGFCPQGHAPGPTAKDSSSSSKLKSGTKGLWAHPSHSLTLPLPPPPKTQRNTWADASIPCSEMPGKWSRLTHAADGDHSVGGTGIAGKEEGTFCHMVKEGVPGSQILRNETSSQCHLSCLPRTKVPTTEGFTEMTESIKGTIFKTGDTESMYQAQISAVQYSASY